MKSNREDTRPSFQFYPKDWMTDDGLQSCSLSARGLWIELLCLMFFSPIRGALLNANKIQKTEKDLTKLDTKLDTKRIQNLLKELESNNVFSRLEDGTIINRKMYRDWQLSRKRQEAVNTRWHTKDYTQNDTKPIQMDGEAVVSLGDVSLAVSKDKYLDFVFLSSDEFGKLKEKLGEHKVEELIKRLNGYIGQIGEVAAKKKYASHYFTILNWNRRDKKPKNAGTLDATLEYIREQEKKEGKGE